MTAPEVVVISTGCANLASVCAAFRRLGAAPVVTRDHRAIETARAVVLPGVGSFGAGMHALRGSGLADRLAARVRSGRSLLAICLGLQLLCDQSEESPGVRGLGLVPGTVRRLGQAPRVPQMGWNQIDPRPRPPADAPALLAPARMYFANSFALGTIPEGWHGATTEYGGAFVSALQRGPLLACQFHPELSARAGLELMQRWLT